MLLLYRYKFFHNDNWTKPHPLVDILISLIHPSSLFMNYTEF